ncbi:MAG: oxygen-independent coproporphyrinogen oxidase [Clostridia bacterium]|jgi:oxygen-independent coproporphyrinogen-3 oxidase|nr:oxygen-independent coproporphyrinogen oxidase [Clostridia bacterium]MDN5323190.1 oxygen-independent coproporphyrinogen oxidase [Clostridia bacterium]
MKITLSQNSKQYASIIFDVIRIFLPQLTWQELTGERATSAEVLDIAVKEKEIVVSLNIQNKIIQPIISTDNNELRRIIKLAVYKLFIQFLGYKGSPWGILTGIRPTKIVHRLWDDGYNARQIQDILEDKFLLNTEKAQKLIDVTSIQRKYFLSTEQAQRLVSIYISIPFCPTRCYYCSFPAFSLKKWGSYIPSYLDNLINEIKMVGQALQQKDIKVQTIYVGGGTPTSLVAHELELLLKAIYNYLYSGDTVEFTVEAGRPDTITEEKLAILKNFLVNRISINPQTMWESTLEKIGRKHSTQDIFDKIHLARKTGFDIINMDLIIGLPGENLENLQYTFKKVDVVKPENLTLHTLAFKRTAKLQQNSQAVKSLTPVEEMFAFAEKWCFEKGYQPYYLYRQKQILANLENVGYSMGDKPCIYNIQMIEERQTIWGLGVGSGSKIVNPADWTLVNKYNPKDLVVYNQRINEIVQAKVDKILGLG